MPVTHEKRWPQWSHSPSVACKEAGLGKDCQSGKGPGTGLSSLSHKYSCLSLQHWSPHCLCSVTHQWSWGIKVLHPQGVSQTRYTDLLHGESLLSFSFGPSVNKGHQLWWGPQSIWNYSFGSPDDMDFQSLPNLSWFAQGTRCKKVLYPKRNPLLSHPYQIHSQASHTGIPQPSAARKYYPSLCLYLPVQTQRWLMCLDSSPLFPSPLMRCWAMRSRLSGKSLHEKW